MRENGQTEVWKIRKKESLNNKKKEHDEKRKRERGIISQSTSTLQCR